MGIQFLTFHPFKCQELINHWYGKAASSPTTLVMYTKEIYRYCFTHITFICLKGSRFNKVEWKLAKLTSDSELHVLDLFVRWSQLKVADMTEIKFKTDWFTLAWPKFPSFPQINIPLLSRVHHQPLLPAVLVSFPLLLQYQPSFAQSLSKSADPSYKWKCNTVKLHNNHLDNCNHIQHSLANCNNLKKLFMFPVLLQWVHGIILPL